MVIVIKSNAKAVAQVFRHISKRLGDSSKPLTKLAISGKATAQRLAPRKTGALRKGIHYRVFKRRMELISMVPKSFPYQMWVNGVDITTIRGRWPFFKGRQGAIAYGQAGIVAPSGASINWTGTHGYFDLTIQKLEKESGRVFDIHVGNILKAKG